MIRQAVRFRFALYGAVVGISIALLILAEVQLVSAVAALLLVTTMLVAGHDLQRSLLERLGNLLPVVRETRRLGQSTAAGIEDLRSRPLGDGLGDLRVELAAVKTIAEQSRAAAEAAIARSPSRSRTAAIDSSAGRPRVLFVTSNGSGMGHLTRLAAVARAGTGQFDSTFVSLSSAAQVAADQGFDVLRVASQQTSRIGWPEWNRRFARLFADTVATTAPDAVVFDGIRIFRGVHEVTRQRGIPLVWMCRGLWKPEVDTTHLRRWRDTSDLVIQPSEGLLLARDTSLALNDDESLIVDPIVYEGAFRQDSRLTALDALGLDPSRRHVLIQLGSGALESREGWERAAVEAVKTLGDPWRAVVLRSPLASANHPSVEDATVLRRYPIASQLAAFDFSVNAAGYNTVHENVAAGHPAVYAPDLHMLTDDQQRRARAICDRGGGVLAMQPQAVHEAVRLMSRDDALRETRERLDRLAVPSGAQAAADAIERLAVGSHSPLQATWFRPKGNR